MPRVRKTKTKQNKTKQNKQTNKKTLQKHFSFGNPSNLVEWEKLSPISEHGKHTNICTFEALFVCTLRELFIDMLY